MTNEWLFDKLPRPNEEIKNLYEPAAEEIAQAILGGVSMVIGVGAHRMGKSTNVPYLLSQKLAPQGFSVAEIFPSDLFIYEKDVSWYNKHISPVEKGVMVVHSGATLFRKDTKSELIKQIESQGYVPVVLVSYNRGHREERVSVINDWIKTYVADKRRIKKPTIIDLQVHSLPFNLIKRYLHCSEEILQAIQKYFPYGINVQELIHLKYASSPSDVKEIAQSSQE